MKYLSVPYQTKRRFKMRDDPPTSASAHRCVVYEIMQVVPAFHGTLGQNPEVPVPVLQGSGQPGFPAVPKVLEALVDQVTAGGISVKKGGFCVSDLSTIVGQVGLYLKPSGQMIFFALKTPLNFNKGLMTPFKVKIKLFLPLTKGLITPLKVFCYYL